MNLEDSIRMAREAGFTEGERALLGDNLIRFAELVRNDEREACAKIAEKMLRFYTQAVTGVPEAIRARGEE